MNIKPTNQKQNSNTIMSAASNDNPAKKVKTIMPKIKQKKKDLTLSIDSDALSLHPTDSSENEETMSIASDSSVIDTFI